MKSFPFGRMIIVCALLASFILSRSHRASAAETQAARPNIVFILSDDQGYADCGFMGSKEITTPNLDKLAHAGTILKSLYVQPVCSPTRAALMTGRYPVHTGVFDYIPPDARGGLNLRERTLAEALREAGYQTAITGKWHLGRHDPRLRPMQRGFDQQYGLWGGSINHFTHKNGKVVDWYRNDQPCADEGYSTHLIAQEACRIIREKPADKPLLLYVPFVAVHGPFQAPDEYLKLYPNLQGQRRTYAAMVTAMDEAIGKIVAALEEKGIRENTLIVFSSDNGGPAPVEITSNVPLRGGKGEIYEGGVRACACVNWPGKIPLGKVNDEPLHMADWYPTLIKLGGGSLEQKLPLDGLDIWPVLTQAAKSPHDAILLCGRTRAETALRAGDWKLLHFAAGEDQLYNIAADIGEVHDLAKEQPEKVMKLREHIARLFPNLPSVREAVSEQAKELKGPVDEKE